MQPAPRPRDLLQALAKAEDALKVCEDTLNAMQVDHCQVSSRADDWAGTTAGVGVLCGVNMTTGSVFPPASQKVCPGKQVQLRYTVNNHTKLRDVLVKSEVWFSFDMALNTLDGNDTQSPDIREFTLRAASSAPIAPIGQVFRLPAKVQPIRRATPTSLSARFHTTRTPAGVCWRRKPISLTMQSWYASSRSIRPLAAEAAAAPLHPASAGRGHAGGVHQTILLVHAV